jgi:hypothetical protein
MLVEDVLVYEWEYKLVYFWRSIRNVFTLSL